MTTSDFTDERIQRIAAATFNETDGEGAVAEWWDLLASIDKDLATLTERGLMRSLGKSQAPFLLGETPGHSLPRSVSAASHTTTDQHADAVLAELNSGYDKSGHHPRCATRTGDGCDCYAQARQPARDSLAALRSRAAAADQLAQAARMLKDVAAADEERMPQSEWIMESLKAHAAVFAALAAFDAATRNDTC